MAMVVGVASLFIIALFEKSTMKYIGLCCLIVVLSMIGTFAIKIYDQSQMISHETGTPWRG